MADFDIDALLDASLNKKPAPEASAEEKKRQVDDGDDRDNKKRRRSDSPSSDRDKSRDRSKERDTNGKDRDVDKDRNGSRDRDRRDSRDRDREKDRDRDRDRRDRDRDRDRDRSRDYRRRSPERDYRDRDRDRRDRDRDYRSRDRDRDRDYRRSPDRDRRRSPGRDARDKDREWERDRRLQREERDRREREMSVKDREAVEAERDSRTVFAINLPIRASERQLWDFFEKTGPVQDIRLISDRNSRKSKGFGYIEFKDRECVQKSLSSSGTVFMGQSIIIQVTQAEKNRVVNTSSSVSSAATGPTRLYVGSLHFNISEDDLRTVFSPFGDIEFINLHMDPETNRSKGFGFVQFRKSEDAKRALQQVNGLEIAGRQIKVGLVNETNAAGGGGGYGELDDDEGGGMSLNAQTRAELMAKLQRGAAPASAAGGAAIPALTPAAPASSGFTGVGATPFVMLKNMFDPTAETDPNFHLEIKEDVYEECSKHGPVRHISVDKDSMGHVYLKFASSDGAQRAVNSLNGRWFAGKMISAEYYPEATYYIKFPEARTA